MKMMILGIDGLGWENLEAFGLSRLKARLSAGVSGNPQVENIISRGWCEIYSGQDCYSTGAFFQVPVKKGKRIIASQSTGADRVAAHVGEDKLLWNKLNSLGLSVGIFTVPTVTKPFEIDGFVVAGTGGGNFGGGLGAGSVWPEDLFKHRRASGVDLGFRYGFGAFQPRSVDELELAANSHLALFFHQVRMALQARPVDVAFIGTRFITELGYKFHQLVIREPVDETEAAVKALVLDLCASFDAMLNQFIEEQNPTSLFVVSDHGLGEFTHRVNLNQALVELGYLRVSKARTAARRFRHELRKVQANHPVKADVGFSYDYAGSTCFSIGYCNTVYINDARFFGPKMSETERHALASRVARELESLCNGAPGMSDVTFQATGLSAWTAADDAWKLPQPDIRAKFPNGLANLGTGPAISVTNRCDFGEEHFNRGVPGEYSGIKTNDTLAGYVGPCSDRVTQNRMTDLYGSILNVADALV